MGRKKYITTREVAELLNINEKMVYTLVNSKGLPATKVTGKWLFEQNLVEDWLDINMINGPDQAQRLSSDSGPILLAGSDDPLFQDVLEMFNRRHSAAQGFFANVGSMGGLRALRRGLCHIGVCHLLQDDEQEYNFSFADEELERLPVFVNFSLRRQGIVVGRGNPKKIGDIEDMARPNVSIVNRPLGTGTRLLLDYEIAKSAISTAQIDGYEREVARHIDAGLAILGGRADCAIAIEAVAFRLGLDFIPLRWERFDLLIARGCFFEENIQKFLALLQDSQVVEWVRNYVGYDTSMMGKMVFPHDTPERGKKWEE